MKVLIGDTIFMPPTGEGTAILFGDLSHGKFEPFSREGHYLHFSFILRPWEYCIGLAPRIEPTTFHSAVKCSNDWADSVVVKQCNFSQYPQEERKKKKGTADSSEVQSAYISNETLCYKFHKAFQITKLQAKIRYLNLCFLSLFLCAHVW